MAESQDYLLKDAIEEYTIDYLNQVFLIHYLLKSAQYVISNERQFKESFEKVDSFVSADAWIECAKDAIKTFEPFVKTSKQQAEEE